MSIIHGFSVGIKSTVCPFGVFFTTYRCDVALILIETLLLVKDSEETSF